MKYPLLEKSLVTERTFRVDGFGDYLRRGPQDILKGQLAKLPVILKEEEWHTTFRTSSYARTPGTGISELEALMQQKLPEDLASFYEQYAEAFVVTRTLPLHLWDIKTMKDWYNKMRYTYPYPIRFLRFADYWDMKATQFALWKPNPELENWIVVTTDIGQLDDHYDEIGFKDYYKVGDSFSEWLNDWIARDGLPDPFMKIGSEGGIIDPV